MAENIAVTSAVPSAEPAAVSGDCFSSPTVTDGTEVARNNDVTVADREKAARLIQRTYRGYRTRRELQGLGVNASARWSEALKEARWRQLYRPSVSPEGTGPDASRQVHEKWERVVSVAMQVGSDDGKYRKETDPSKRPTASPAATGRPSESAPADASSTSRSRFLHSFPILHHGVPSEKMAKMMDQRYFLEMVDLKHRHGSNLRKYHNYWKNCPSTQNFFYWLDHGEGKDLDLPECPRAKLEHQQVRYLSRDERLNYLVTVDQAGLFRWAKNNELVCTDSTRFKDSLKGVVPIDEDAPQFRGHSEAGYPVAYASSSSSSPSQSSTDEDSADDNPSEQINQGYEEAKGVHKLAHITPSVVRDHFTRKPAKRKDMWLFVADTSFRLYIGIKEKGAFQHSSFLRGARVAAAGLIKIWNGQLRSVTPLSGHYRPPSANFRAFVHALQDQGVDMSHVSITKSYAILAGMEGYVRTKHKLRALHETLDDSKEKLLHGRQRQNDRHVEKDAQVPDEKAIHKDQAECLSATANEESLSANDKETDGRALPARVKIHQASASQDPINPSDEPATMPADDQ
ncbi:hypothetical protein IFM58399_08955 [Aspergillus lentulus]|uniref:IQ calmodulin-binding motif protein n=1 Tax=Aspergillus lentulus TaxID=293939 RepID=A0AAN5YJ51_ASPLE|nr:uncharacterized protein IFM58399_08955 [Aspergillus lentulus]KAF4179352.1 hypothetical protein CNMCM8060_003215 [Aspergillus lentulus]KAF4182643.1 hypothetical protein CNMCM7927_009505 [Aspergillus lentulus]KAF4198760.1 hypothetical protein CNMCM8694_008110 [Aspergillus lentulus]KAF4202322.1 hypothetical protein CNMCM8927_000338 [Aspergillus lentulus]GFF51018.1 hypothetical protein IFM58399_08955 [Aspergillus lentulus]